MQVHKYYVRMSCHKTTVHFRFFNVPLLFLLLSHEHVHVDDNDYDYADVDGDADDSDVYCLTARGECAIKHIKFEVLCLSY